MSSAEQTRPVAAAVQARKRRSRIQWTVGVVVLVVAVVAAAWVLMSATTTPTGCSSLAIGGASEATPLQLVIELQGNTDHDAEHVSGFVAAQLKAMTADVTKAYDVRVVFVRYGQVVDPPGCLASPRRISSPQEDLDTYAGSQTSADNRKQLQATLERNRATQISWLADEVGAQVRQVSFTGLDPKVPELSPRLVWQAALRNDAPQAFLAVYSPMLSTVDDCLATPHADPGPGASSTPSAAEQVAGCLRFNQLAASKAAKTSVVVDASLLDAAQRQRALAVRDALCQQATVDHCSATPAES